MTSQATRDALAVAAYLHSCAKTERVQGTKESGNG